MPARPPTGLCRPGCVDRAVSTGLCSTGFCRSSGPLRPEDRSEIQAGLTTTLQATPFWPAIAELAVAPG